MVNNDIVEWCGGSSCYTATWKSGKVITSVPVNFGWCQIFSQNWPVTVRVYADGVMKSSNTVYSNAPFCLSSGYLATVWEVEIIGGNGVYRAALATSMEELGG